MKAVKIPADIEQPIHLTDVEYGWENFAKAIGGPCKYIERFRCPLTIFHLVGVLDEDGQYNGQPDNIRAWPLYPLEGYQLKGDVLVMKEGMTPDGPDFIDMADDGAAALSLVLGLLEGATHA